MTYFLLRTFSRVISRLPRPWTLNLGKLLGSLLYLVFPYRKDVAWENLARGLPDRSPRQRRTILRRAYRHFGMVLIDFARLGNIHRERLSRIVTIDEASLSELQPDSRGTILMSGHLGNWEMIPPALNLRGYPIVSIAIGQRRAGGRYVEEVRRSAGHRSIPRDAPSRTMLELLQAGNILGLAADQDARRDGVWVRFLGQPSSRYRGGALFHLHTDAPLVFCACLMEKGDHYRLSFKRISTDGLPEDRREAVRVLTQRFCDLLTEVVHRHPEQYFWFHRMWKTCPEPGRRARPGSRSR